MSNQARTSRIIISLIASMTIGALVLMALDNHSLSAGAFSLAGYTNLNPIEQVTLNSVMPGKQKWDFIEIYYSGTDAGDIEDIARFNGLTNSEDVNFHFLVCNGTGEADGKIQAATKWRKQRAALGGQDWFGNNQTIRICVVADGLKFLPTDCQLKRTTGLVEVLVRKFDISARRISYPANWKL
jgi:hypothetical protein